MKNLLFCLSLLLLPFPVWAGQSVTGNLTVTGNTGLGTTTPGSSLTILKNGSADYMHINSTAAAGGNLFKVSNGGNIGINSTAPGVTLDIQGTLRVSSTITGSNLSGTNTGDQTNIVGNAGTATALAANGSNCTAGNYPLGVDASGAVENCTAVTSSQWATQNTTDVSLAGGNVGIGTTATTTAAMTVMNGNVGLGTWVPKNMLDVRGGTALGAYAGLNSPTANGLIISGNVGIGTTATTTQLRVGSASGFVVDSSGNITGVGNITSSAGTITANTTGSSIANVGISDSNGATLSRGLNFDGSNRINFTISATGHNGSTDSQTSTGLQVNASSSLSGNSTTSTGVNITKTETHTSGTMNNLVGLNVSNVVNGSGGTTTNSYGLKTGTATVTAGTVTRNYSFGSNGWSIFSGNVGIGTALASDVYTQTSNLGKNGSLTMYGNLGVGTYTMTNALDVNGGAAIGSYAGANSATSNGLIVSGNVGVGSPTPGQKLDVQGTVRIFQGGSASTGACWCADGVTLGHDTAIIGAGGSASCATGAGAC